MSVTFTDRADAGRRLAKAVEPYVTAQSIVCALPRGGVPVAFEVAQYCKLPFTVLVVRKLGYPRQPEFGIGALAEQGICLLNRSTIQRLAILKADLNKIIKAETSELNRRVKLYREGKGLPSVKDKQVIVVDDGIATGVTMRAAIAALKKRKAGSVLCAVPVTSQQAAREIRSHVDRFITLHEPHDFEPVSKYYSNFNQTTDDEVRALLLSNFHTRIM